MKITKKQLKQIIKEELSATARLEPQWVDAYVEKIYNLLVKANKEVIEDTELEAAHKQLAVLARSAKAEKGYEHHDIEPRALKPVDVSFKTPPGRTWGVPRIREMIKEELEALMEMRAASRGTRVGPMAPSTLPSYRDNVAASQARWTGAGPGGYPEFGFSGSDESWQFYQIAAGKFGVTDEVKKKGVVEVEKIYRRVWDYIHSVKPVISKRTGEELDDPTDAQQVEAAYNKWKEE